MIETREMAYKFGEQMYDAMAGESNISRQTLESAVKKYFGMSIYLSTEKLHHYQRTKLENFIGVLRQEELFEYDEKTERFVLNRAKIRKYKYREDADELIQPEPKN